MEPNFGGTMEHIVASIRTAGYNPYAQLYGYFQTGDETYITRTGDASTSVKTLECSQLQRYVDELRWTV